MIHTRIVTVWTLATAMALAASCAGAKLTVTGDPASAASLEAMILQCSQESKAFKALMVKVKDSKHTIELDMVTGADAAGVFFDEYVKPGKAKVNWKHIAALPCPHFDPATKSFKLPPGVPAWAFTCCEELAHILAEQEHSVDMPGGGLKGNHAAAIATENLVRTDLGQKERTSIISLDNTKVPPVITITINPHKEVIELVNGDIKITYKPLA